MLSGLLHKMILEQTGTFEKEAYFLLLLTQLMRRYHHPLPPALSDCRREVETACTFMEENFAQRLSLSPDLSPNRLEQSTPLTGLYQVQRCHALPLLGEYSC